VDPGNSIAKNGATAVSNYLIENVIGVLEISSVPESYTITGSFENMYFFIILILFSIFCDIYHVQRRKTYTRGWRVPLVYDIIKNAFPVLWMAVIIAEGKVSLLHLLERNK
jgi:hypothetical protein